MPRCPVCGKREVPARDWLFYGLAQCRKCHTNVERSRFAGEILVRSIHVVPLIIVLVAMTSETMNMRLFVAIGLLGFGLWITLLYFSRPVPCGGDLIGPSRSTRLLTPVILIVAVIFIVWSFYWLLVA